MTTNEQAASATNNVQQSSGDLFGYEVDIEAVSRALARRLIPSPPSASCLMRDRVRDQSVSPRPDNTPLV